MTRYEWEAYDAAKRGKSVKEMGALGYISARCECAQDDCCGWQTVAVPPESPEFERRNLLAALRGLDPQPFGGA